MRSCGARRSDPGASPSSAAAASEILVMIVTVVPGEPVPGLQLSARDEQQVHWQAGQLLRRLHENRTATTAGEDAGRLTSQVDGNLGHVGGLLSPAQRALARDCASRLTRLGRRFWSWPATGLPAAQLAVGYRQRPAGDHRLSNARSPQLPSVTSPGSWTARGTASPTCASTSSPGTGAPSPRQEDKALFCYTVLDALSGLRWGLANGDDAVVSRAWRTFERFA